MAFLTGLTLAAEGSGHVVEHDDVFDHLVLQAVFTPHDDVPLGLEPITALLPTELVHPILSR